MYQNAVILPAFLLMYSAVAARVERSWLSGTVFTGAELLLGPYGLGVVRLNLGVAGAMLVQAATVGTRAVAARLPAISVLSRNAARTR